MATQPPFFVATNDWNPAQPFPGSDPKPPFIQRVGIIAGADLVIFGLAHLDIKTLTILLPNAGRFSFGPQVNGDPMLEPWFPIEANVPFVVDLTECKCDIGGVFQVFYVSSAVNLVNAHFIGEP